MIVLLTTKGQLGDMFIAGLAREFPDLIVIFEEALSEAATRKIRLKRLGWFHLLGIQLARFPMRVMSFLTKATRNRIIAGIPTDYSVKTYDVPSVNSPECLALLRELNPSKIAVYSTRILKQETLDFIDAPFINFHCGINPKYRGQFPLYWALAKDDEANCGVTVHLVDKGIDTGGVLLQERMSFSRMETHSTQFYKSLPVGVRLMTRALREDITPHVVDLPSELHFPPTIWQYIYYGLRRLRF